MGNEWFIVEKWIYRASVVFFLYCAYSELIAIHEVLDKLNNNIDSIKSLIQGD